MIQFNREKLIQLTLIISCLGMLSFSDSDHAAAFYLGAGFVYTVILYISVNQKPTIFRFLLVLLLLGVCNVYVYFSTMSVAFIPEPYRNYFIFLAPSLLGASITLLCLVKIWKIKLSKFQVKRVLICVAIASLASPIVIELLQLLFDSNGGFLSLNSVFWLLAFTFGIVFRDNHANKAIKSDI